VQRIDFCPPICPTLPSTTSTPTSRRPEPEGTLVYPDHWPRLTFMPDRRTHNSISHARSQSLAEHIHKLQPSKGQAPRRKRVFRHADEAPCQTDAGLSAGMGAATCIGACALHGASSDSCSSRNSLANDKSESTRIGFQRTRTNTVGCPKTCAAICTYFFYGLCFWIVLPIPSLLFG
jgi:hypothetical protein